MGVVPERGCLLYTTEVTVSRDVRCVGNKGAVFNLKRTAESAENSATSVGAVDGRSDWVMGCWKWELDEGLADEAQPII